MRTDAMEKSPAVSKIWLPLVILASILYVLFLANGDPEAFLVDDNRTQWYPVMERAYEDFWTTGRIYCYDFYQMKGMSIAGQGYYGVMNPFILLSYSLTKVLPGGIDAITFYIGVMVVLGNLFCYLTCRRLGCKEGTAFLMTLTYGTMGCFWAFFYWYYVFNNYFLVPLLVYLFLRFSQEDKISYCACGIVLAMDLWMGNVQYTFYHYLLFGILCLTMILLKNKCYFKILCTNAAVGVLLSLPMLLLLLQTSDGLEGRAVLMQYPLLIFSLLIHSAIPQGILRRHGSSFSFLDSYVMARDDNLVCYMGVVGIALFLAFLCAVARFFRRAGKIGTFRGLFRELRAGYDRAAALPHEKKVTAGCAAALFFFLSLMSGGMAACLFSITPVIKNFRYFFKAVFPAAPLAVLLFAYLVGAERVTGAKDCGRKKQMGTDDERATGGDENGAGRRLRHAALIVTAVYACVGVVNARDAVAVTRNLFDVRIAGTFAEEKEDAKTFLSTAAVDGKNYRTAAFLQFSGVNDECFDPSRNLTRNFATAVGAFSLAAYEPSEAPDRMKAFDAVYSDPDFYAKFANADTLENFYYNLRSKPETVQRQLTENGVRYLLLDRTAPADNRMAQENGGTVLWKDRREDVIAALRDLPGLCVERVCPFNEHYDLVELSGTDSLCMDEAGHMVPLTDENMQTLSFAAETAGDYFLSFAWDSRLKAFLTKDGSAAEELPVEETENGKIRISTAGSTGRVTLVRQDPLCTAGFVWESVTTFAFFALMLAIAFLGKKCYSGV
ncbi:MAG: hypothetical protein NC430_04205 [bacterium]|nr:hypothetical protein [bacterium]MCM1423809.1 hypothetical protein [bacterium]